MASLGAGQVLCVLGTPGAVVETLRQLGLAVPSPFFEKVEEDEVDYEVVDDEGNTGDAPISACEKEDKVEKTSELPAEMQPRGLPEASTHDVSISACEELRPMSSWIDTSQHLTKKTLSANLTKVVFLVQS